MRAERQQTEPGAAFGRMRAFGTARTGRAALALATALLLAGCSSDQDPRLMHLSSGNKPDEFGILPTRALEAPPDYRSLPAPTPGGTNRTDPTPIADAVVALGGRASALAQPQTGADGALLAHAGRMGTDPAIRGDLAGSDLEWRRQNNGRLLERLFKVNVYNKAYRQQELDQHAELERLRQAGVKTPAAPPDPLLAPR